MLCVSKTGMVEIAEQTRRRRGRPQIRSDKDTRKLLIEAARQEFQVNGYAGTCINDVAQRAGVSTKTMYRLIPNKADLLGRVISDTIGKFMIDFDAKALDALPLEDAVERMLIAYGSLTLSEETIAMNRLVIREYGYLLDTTTPHMLWGDECRIRCWSHLDGLLCQPEKQLAS